MAHHRTLLLVDDEPALLHALQRVFHAEDCRLLTAASGMEALRLLDKNDVQVVLADHRMPEMSGVELLTRVRAAHPDCVRMILSGYADIEAITAAINSGHVYKFLNKPWDNASLLENVHAAFERHDETHRARLFSSIYRHTREGIVIIDPQGCVEDINPAFAALTGYAPEEVIGLSIGQLIPDSANTDAQSAILAQLQQEGHWRGEHWARRRNGEHFPLELNLSVLCDEHGKISRYVALCADISERKSREIALRESEKRFRDIMEFAPIGMVIVDLEGHLLRVNQALCDILGYRRDELEGLNFEQITHPDDLAQDLGNRRQLLTGQLPVIRAEKRYLHRAGHIVWVQLTAALLRDTHGVPQCIDAQIEDITERKRDRDHIRELAYYDALTGLPNRRLFKERLDHALVEAIRHERPLAVMFLDLDHFKQINDTHGHDIGDELLQSVAGRLSAGLRGGDTVARQGGDEFVIILAEITHPADAAHVAEKLASNLARPLAVGTLSLQITTSIGIALYPSHGLDAATLMRHADSALYAVKEAGRNGFRFYQSDTVPPASTFPVAQ